MPNNFDIFAKAVSGDPLAEHQAKMIILQGIKAYFRSNFKIDFRRCIGLDRSVTKLISHKRDYWLLVAHRYSTGHSNWAKCIYLANEIKLINSVWWPKWKYIERPPAELSELRKALFFVFKYGYQMNPDNPRIPTTAQQISNLIKKN